ncbi:hypothetical protein J7L48_06390 [bacterium]|nr:hypothetical protein [bacterium]
MKINSFDFGSIRIDGKKYDKDVILFRNSVETKESTHIIKRSDIEKIIIEDSSLIIIGTGTIGRVRITEDAKKLIMDEKKELIMEKTPIAIEKFNENKNAVGIFHITC